MKRGAAEERLAFRIVDQAADGLIAERVYGVQRAARHRIVAGDRRAQRPIVTGTGIVDVPAVVRACDRAHAARRIGHHARVVREAERPLGVVFHQFAARVGAHVDLAADLLHEVDLPPGPAATVRPFAGAQVQLPEAGVDIGGADEPLLVNLAHRQGIADAVRRQATGGFERAGVRVEPEEHAERIDRDQLAGLRQMQVEDVAVGNLQQVVDSSGRDVPRMDRNVAAIVERAEDAAVVPAEPGHLALGSRAIVEGAPRRVIPAASVEIPAPLFVADEPAGALLVGVLRPHALGGDALRLDGFVPRVPAEEHFAWDLQRHAVGSVSVGEREARQAFRDGHVMDPCRPAHAGVERHRRRGLNLGLVVERLAHRQQLARGRVVRHSLEDARFGHARRIGPPAAAAQVQSDHTVQPSAQPQRVRPDVDSAVEPLVLPGEPVGAALPPLVEAQAGAAGAAVVGGDPEAFNAPPVDAQAQQGGVDDGVARLGHRIDPGVDLPNALSLLLW